MTTLNQAVKSLNVRRGVESALNNELKTRERVKRLENGMHMLACRQRLEDLTASGFRGRLRWLLFGKVDK